MIISTKLKAPLPHKNSVIRTRLHAYLDNWRAYRCSYIHGPAGYGKSTLVALWLESLRHPAPDPAAAPQVAWLSLDDGDSDPHQFVRYVAAALERIHPGVLEAIRPILSDAGSGPERAMSQLLATLRPQPLPESPDRLYVLVLDDYHRAACPAVDALTTMLLERAPAWLHIMLLSRQTTAAPLNRFYAAGRVLEITGSDLRFRRDELRAYLALLGLENLGDEVVELLLARTEGWIAALQLAGVGALQQKNADDLLNKLKGNQGWLAGYLTDELLATQPVERRQFLLASAILDRFSAPLAAIVTGATDVYRMLTELTAANLFLIPLDDHNEWVRYHHLFQELLLHRLRADESPATIAALHRRAAMWLADDGDIDAAITHFLAIPDEEGAAGLVAAHTRPAMLRGDSYRAKRWIDRLPARAVNHSMPLLLDRCRLGVLHDNAHLLELVEQAETALAALMPSAPWVEQSRAELLVHRAIGHYHDGDLPAADGYSRQAQAQAEWLDDLSTGYLKFTLMHLYGKKGDLQAALAHGEQAAEAFERAGFALGGRISIRRAAASLAMNAGQSKEAERQFERLFALVKFEQPFALRELAIAHFGAARHYYWLDRIADAHHHQQMALSLARRLHDEVLLVAARCFGQLCHATAPALAPDPEPFDPAHFDATAGQVSIFREEWVRLLVKRGNLAAAWQRTHHLSGLLVEEISDYIGAQELAYLLAHTACGIDLETTTPLFEHALAQTKKETNGLTRLRLLSLFAWHQWRLRNEDSALELLGQALELADQTEYIRGILDTPGLAPLLAETHHPTATRLLRQMEYENQLIDLTRLTPQERIVLELLAKDDKYREIAEALNISMDTVRFHVRNIYRKLGVNRRFEAAQVAWKAGLVDERASS